MSQEKLLSDLHESRAEIQRLRDCLSMGTPTIHKDLSLISLIPKWSGSESAVPLEEFISSIEGAAKLGNWQDSDGVRIGALKLTDLVRSFYNTCKTFIRKIRHGKNSRCFGRDSRTYARTNIIL